MTKEEMKVIKPDLIGREFIIYYSIKLDVK